MTEAGNAQRDVLISWLNDAHGAEMALIQALERQVDQTDAAPHLQTRLREHLQQTRRHADLVEGCVQRLGSSTSSLKSGMGTAAGFLKGLGTAMSDDEMVKNMIANYTAEQMEIASYKAIIVAAEQLGDIQTVEVCRSILREEEDMAQWVQQQIESVVRGYLVEKSVEA